jgi:hypothetical protein
VIGHASGSGNDGHRGRRAPLHERPHAAGDERSQKRDAFASVLSAGTLASSAGVLISRLDALRRDGRAEDAARKLHKSLVEQPSLAAGLIAALDAAGRPADVAWVLHEACDLDAEHCGRIIAVLWHAGLPSHVPTLLGFVESHKLCDIATWAMSEGLETDACGAVDLLISATLARPIDAVVDRAFQWRKACRERDAANLFGVLAQARPSALLAAAEDLAARRQVPESEELLVSYVQQASPHDAILLFAALVGSLPDFVDRTAEAVADRADAHELLHALVETLPGEYTELCLGEIISRLTSERLVWLCAQLHDHALPDVLELVLIRCVGYVDAAHLVKALHAASLHYAGYRVAELTGQFDDFHVTSRTPSGRTW